jgi:hypothetical protein
MHVVPKACNVGDNSLQLASKKMEVNGFGRFHAENLASLDDYHHPTSSRSAMP